MLGSSDGNFNQRLLMLWIKEAFERWLFFTKHMQTLIALTEWYMNFHLWALKIQGERSDLMAIMSPHFPITVSACICYEDWHSARWKCFQMFTNWDVWERKRGEKIWQLIRRDVWMQKEGGEIEKFGTKDSPQRNHHNLFFCLPNPWKRFYKYMMGARSEEGGGEKNRNVSSLGKSEVENVCSLKGARSVMHKFMFIASAAICISYRLFVDRDV